MASGACDFDRASLARSATRSAVKVVLDGEDEDEDMDVGQSASSSSEEDDNPCNYNCEVCGR